MTNYNLISGLKDTYKFTEGYRRPLLFYFFLTVGVSAIAMIPPYLYGQIVGKFNGNDFSNIYEYILITAIALIIVTVVTNVVSYKTKILAEYIRNNARIKSLAHLYSLDYEFFETNATGVFLSRITNGSGAVRTMIKRLFTGVFQQILELIFAFILILTLDWKVGFFSLVIFAFFSTFTIKSNWHYQKLNRKVASASEITYDQVLEFSSKIKIVKFLNAKKKLLKILDRSYEEVIDRNRSLRAYERIMTSIQALILDLSTVGLLGYLAYIAINDIETVAAVVSIYAYYTKITARSHKLLKEYEDLMDTTTELQRLSLVFDAKPTIELTDKKYENIDSINDIEFKNVSYTYKKGDKKALTDLNLRIKKGDKVAIVGESGSGKSTLSKLLLKLYLPNEGELLLNNKLIDSISFESIINSIKVVPQHNELVNASIRNNILLGTNLEATDEEILEALHKAEIRDFVLDLEKGLDTIVGSSGVQLSGGQVQRICIARALIDKPEILLLDEATSNLDPVTEKNIYTNIIDSDNLTLISITHRLNICPSMDRIIVMDKTRKIAEDIHSELLKTSEVYKHLWENGKYE